MFQDVLYAADALQHQMNDALSGDKKLRLLSLKEKALLEHHTSPMS